MIDVSFGEDASCKRDKNSPMNLSMLFETVLFMLKKYKPYKKNLSFKAK